MKASSPTDESKRAQDAEVPPLKAPPSPIPPEAGQERAVPAPAVPTGVAVAGGAAPGTDAIKRKATPDESDEFRPPDEERDYVGPRLLPEVRRPKSPEPEAKVVLNLPVDNSAKAGAEEVKQARARRRTATIRVARADVPELQEMHRKRGLSAPPRPVPPPPGSHPDVASSGIVDADIDVDFDDVVPAGVPARSRKPSSLQPPPVRAPIEGRVEVNRRSSAPWFFLLAVAVGGAAVAFIYLEPGMGEATKTGVESGSGASKELSADSAVDEPNTEPPAPTGPSVGSNETPGVAATATNAADSDAAPTPPSPGPTAVSTPPPPASPKTAKAPPPAAPPPMAAPPPAAPPPAAPPPPRPVAPPPVGDIPSSI